MCRLQYVKVINSGYSHISEPAQELHSRAEPSVGGNITSQSVKPQGEILEEDRKKKLNIKKSLPDFCRIFLLLLICVILYIMKIAKYFQIRAVL